MEVTSLKYPFIDGYKDIPRDKDDDVRKIRTWLETQPQLPKLNEEFLHLFLHCNYYNLEETKDNIEAYFSLRSTSSEIFSGRSLSDPKIQNALTYYFFGMAPKRTPEGYQVVFLTLNKKNIRNFVHVDSARLIFSFLDILVSECGLCPGYIIVYDLKPFTLPLYFKLNYGVVKKIVKYLQEAAPIRVKNIICLNSASIMHRLLALCRPIMKTNLLNKLQIHAVGSDLTNFYKTVPRECAFDEYGGTAGSIEIAHENFKALLETKYSKWIEDETIYTVEKQKIEPAKRSFFSFW